MSFVDYIQTFNNECSVGKINSNLHASATAAYIKVFSTHWFTLRRFVCRVKRNFLVVRINSYTISIYFPSLRIDGSGVAIIIIRLSILIYEHIRHMTVDILRLGQAASSCGNLKINPVLFLFRINARAVDGTTNRKRGWQKYLWIQIADII